MAHQEAPLKLRTSVKHNTLGDGWSPEVGGLAHIIHLHYGLPCLAWGCCRPSSPPSQSLCMCRGVRLSGLEGPAMARGAPARGAAGELAGAAGQGRCAVLSPLSRRQDTRVGCSPTPRSPSPCRLLGRRRRAAGAARSPARSRSQEGRRRRRGRDEGRRRPEEGARQPDGPPQAGGALPGGAHHHGQPPPHREPLQEGRAPDPGGRHRDLGRGQGAVGGALCGARPRHVRCACLRAPGLLGSAGAGVAAAAPPAPWDPAAASTAGAGGAWAEAG